MSFLPAGLLSANGFADFGQPPMLSLDTFMRTSLFSLLRSMAMPILAISLVTVIFTDIPSSFGIMSLTIPDIGMPVPYSSG